jgi:hypothetical protein
MRARVQWSVSKPYARAPRRSAWSMAASWGRQACGRPDEAGAAQCLQPARRPAGVPAAGVLPGDTQGVSDLGLGAAGGKQSTNRTSRLPAMPASTSLALGGAGFVEGQPAGSIGDWRIGRRARVLHRADGWIAFRFHARDVDEPGHGTLVQPQFCQLIRQRARSPTAPSRSPSSPSASRPRCSHSARPPTPLRRQTDTSSRKGRIG